MKSIYLEGEQEELTCRNFRQVAENDKVSALLTTNEHTSGASSEDLAQVFYKAATDARPKRRYFHAFSDRAMVWLARSCPRVFKKLFMTALNYLGNRALKKR